MWLERGGSGDTLLGGMGPVLVGRVFALRKSGWPARLRKLPKRVLRPRNTSEQVTGMGSFGIMLPPSAFELANRDLAMLDESDRGCVMVAHAFFDEKLGSLLREYFLRTPTALKSLLDDVLDGSKAFVPLGATARRIEKAKTLSLIEKDIAGAAKAFNVLRNKFAHRSHSDRLELDDVTPIYRHFRGPHKSRVDYFIEMASSSATMRPREPEAQWRSYSDARKKFMGIAAFLWCYVVMESWREQ